MNKKAAQEWCEKNAHMLEALSPVDIVIAWEEYRQRTCPDPLPDSIQWALNSGDGTYRP